MIIVIRISGMVNMTRSAEETLFRMRLRRKYCAILLEDNEFNRKLLQKIRNFVAYGNIDDKTLKELVEKRGRGLKGKKFDFEKVLKGIGKEKLSALGIKPFFRLHPPRGGIESKKHFGVGKGVLGDHGNKIGELLGRMI